MQHLFPNFLQFFFNFFPANNSKSDKLFYSPHPYIFFNHDRDSMTFLGFRLNPNGDLLDPANNTVLERRLMNPTLRGQLNAQGVNFDTDYEKRDRLA